MVGAEGSLLVAEVASVCAASFIALALDFSFSHLSLLQPPNDVSLISKSFYPPSVFYLINGINDSYGEIRGWERMEKVCERNAVGTIRVATSREGRIQHSREMKGIIDDVSYEKICISRLGGGLLVSYNESDNILSRMGWIWDAEIERGEGRL